MDAGDRLTRLEERYAHLQRHSVEQDKAMLELVEEVAQLRKELAAWRERGATPPSANAESDEKPPHY